MLPGPANEPPRWYTTPEQVAGWRVVDSGDDGFVLSGGSPPVTCRLNETALLIWQLVDGERTLDEIAELVADVYDGSKAAIVDDVRAVVDRLRALGIVDFEQRDAPAAGAAQGLREQEMSSLAMARAFPDLRGQHEDSMRQCQAVMIRMLKCFDAICTALGIEYFIMDGTLLGALRHRGFIPFDGDIDVGMIREDYRRFADEGARHLPADMFLQNRDTDPAYPSDHIVKIRDRYSCYVAYAATYPQQAWHHGLQLDIAVHEARGGWLVPIEAPAARQPVRDVYPVSRLCFEDFFPMSPRYPESVISRAYPDFKQLPPPASRFPHEGRASATTPCNHPRSLDWKNRECHRTDR